MLAKIGRDTAKFLSEFKKKIGCLAYSSGIIIIGAFKSM
jgi:hypothetical protein